MLRRMFPISFDEQKNRRNLEKHGVSLADARRLEWDTMLITPDNRRDYGEDRFIGYGLIEGRLYATIYTLRAGRMRVISLRKANKREVKQYENTIR